MLETQTYYDTPERTSDDEIKKVSSMLEKKQFAVNLFYAYPDVVMILDKNRQIVACNKAALVTFQVDEEDEILGKRTGEAISCIHSDDMAGGCGTSIFCRECGAAKAIKYTNETHEASEEECRIISLQQGQEVSYDLHILTKPLNIDEQQLSLVIIQDISNEKRRVALERIFFHDVLNLAGAVNSITEILQEGVPDSEELIDALASSSSQLIKEILAQKDLKNAESGSLEVHPFVLNVNDSLTNVAAIYKNHDVAKQRNIQVKPSTEQVFLETDQVLLERSIGNLVKNALEASEPGQTVTLSASLTDEKVNIHVHNETVMPQNVKSQIFQRSFSTKGETGRGLGTYSVKLLIEEYLKGSIAFTSEESKGTEFIISFDKMNFDI